MESIGRVLGMFSKGTAGSVSVNFGRSGGANCDPCCVHHPQSKAPHPTGACYAVRTEKRPDRGQLAEKLERHESLPPSLVIGAALVELQQLVDRGKTPPWVRLSTSGSLPQPKRATKLFLGQLRVFLIFAKQNGIPVHIPVESHRKARFYRKHLGHLAIVRESLQGSALRVSGPVSLVAGVDVITGRNVRRRRLEAARRVAKQRTAATGRKCIVCPAVAVWFLHPYGHTSKAKCGRCKACTRPDIDIVYPLH